MGKNKGIVRVEQGRKPLGPILQSISLDFVRLNMKRAVDTGSGRRRHKILVCRNQALEAASQSQWAKARGQLIVAPYCVSSISVVDRTTLPSYMYVILSFKTGTTALLT